MATLHLGDGSLPDGDAQAPMPLRGHDARGDFAFVVVHETGRGTVAWLRGDLDVATSPSLLRQLIETLNLPLTNLVVDLADVRDIDRHGLATLRVAQKRAIMRGVDLSFEGVTDASVAIALGVVRAPD
jgi:anti-anti-sigma regulatory factor